MDSKTLYSYFLRSSSVITDSRKIKKRALFFCLKGDNFNGNKFAEEALKKGASFVIVDDLEYPDHYQYSRKYFLKQTLFSVKKQTKCTYFLQKNPTSPSSIVLTSCLLLHSYLFTMLFFLYNQHLIPTMHREYPNKSKKTQFKT